MAHNPITADANKTIEDNGLNQDGIQDEGIKENSIDGESNLRRKLHRVVNFRRSDLIDIFLKAFFILLTVPWFISTIFFSIFDTKCIVLDKASVINCSQDYFISKPRHWMFALQLMSIISCLVLILIIRLNHKKLNYQREKAKKIYKKGSFGSLMFLLMMSLMYYSVRIYNTRSEKTGLVISILVFIWRPVIVVVVCCFNYLPRVYWKNIGIQCNTLKWWKKCLTRNSNFIIYWLALVMYFVEITCRVAGMMLDVAQDVAPLIENKFPNESGKLRGVMFIVIGFNVGLHVRLLSFFWQKLFHGEKDLFTEPNAKLVEDCLVEAEQQDDLETVVTLEEVIVNTTENGVG